MDFELDDTQRTIAASAGQILAREPTETAWKALAQAGLLALALPDRLGGDGLGIIETAVLLTEIGRAAAPLPALPTLALGVLPIVLCGTERQQDELLPEVATGARLLTGPPRPMPVTVTGDTLSGTLTGVGYAAAAHRILVPAAGAIHLVDPDGPGVSSCRTPTSSGGPEYTVTLDHAPATRLGPADGAGSVDRYFGLAAVAACAVGDGLLAGALDLTAAHVRDRRQFGRPLATFQAVAQQIADVYVAARTLHLATMAACWAQSHGSDDAWADVEVAAHWLTERAPAALHVCHHLHGGLGVDIGYPLHRYYSATKDLVRFLGGAEQRLDRLGERVAG